MTPDARLQAAIEVLAEVEASRRPADRVLELYFRARRYAGAKDRRAVAEGVYGVLRRRARLDWWLERLGLPGEARTRALLAASLDGYPLDFQGAHGPSPLSDAERALAGVPAIDHPDMPEAVALECPAWLEPPLRDAFGPDFAAALRALNRPAPVDLRVNTLKATREAARAALAAEGVEAFPTPRSPIGLRLAEPKALGSLGAFREGLVEVQDEGSQLLALAVGAAPGMTVVDYCAGGGGKTLALGAAMGNRGRLIACDSDGRRLAKLDDRRRRAGLGIVETWVLDGTAPDLAADRVLVDAPCSGTGTWRRAPEARWRLDAAALAALRETQGLILDRAAALVAPGGWLIYATCSVLAAENEDIVAAFLAAHPDFALHPVDAATPHLRLAPHATGTDGFFAAVLRFAANRL
ncbi:MAG: RsmB/NOP family class I SAM-dependent RNA methyltransferase [Magnetospirillum sp. WYHS-4]